MISQILFSTLGTIAFAITMKIPKDCILYVFFGALITASVERVLVGYYGDFTACFGAMLCLAFYSEMIARLIKKPTTIILMPSAIPLLPGSSIYYTMLYAISSNRQLMSDYAKSTVLSGLGIALGAVIGSTTVSIINAFKFEKNKHE